ncbi:stage III sporulation protein AE [Halobacillus halophilus]|uniref:Stage III sporulation protein AE n=1 Tax=Halobacillus halophilus (strain ATCC 35676 / DSM 2266 / JCM 20832 / KCTC 3685 / LMG 17431 / NBRC 102448 / NCIMB 2269) TaxID=866895 RepID=I0JNV9_HALH3|nr:stage III sporulation protein AE [Halobacillus halophilus]ASF39874.1 stage III sporulation protein AE [Halobacillus halophilus]CCG45829.1 stage III sporulation protein AE [Halobacillus halophilus DSM 2266]
MKRLSFIVCLLLGIVCFPLISSASQNPDTPPAMLDYISTEELEKSWEELDQDYGDYMPSFNMKNFREYIQNEGSLKTSDWFTGILQFFFQELMLNGKLLASLLFLTLFSTLLQSVQNSFENPVISKIAYLVVYLVLLTLALESFRQVIDYTLEAIDRMSSFMIGLLPLLLGIMASFSHLMSISFFHPIIVALVQSSGLLVKFLLIPLFTSSALLLIVGSLNETYKVDQLAELLRKTGLAVMGIFLTIFLGVISVQGTVTAVQDGVTMKTARFVTGNFVPVVGRLFTDATDTILGASLVLKNTLGIAGVVILLGIAVFPALKVFAIAIIYKMAAALLQPLGDGPIIRAMDVVSRHIMYVFAALLMVSMMFFLVIVIMVAASNITMMVR